MAYGDVGAAVLDFEEFETTTNWYASCLKRAIDVVVVFYSDNENDGICKTYAIDEDGVIGAKLGELEFESSFFFGRQLVVHEVATGVYMLIYRGNSNFVTATTVTVSEDGVTIAVKDSHVTGHVASTAVECVAMKGSTRVFAAVWYGSGQDGYVLAVTCDADGDNIAAPDSWEFQPTRGYLPQIGYIGGDIFAISYSDTDGKGQVSTVSIDDSGTITDLLIDIQEVDVGGAANIAILKPDNGDLVVLAYKGPDGDGWLASLTIDIAGAISAVIDTKEFDTASGIYPKLNDLGTSSGTSYLMVFWNNVDDDATKIATFSITAAGAFSAEIDSLTLKASSGSTAWQAAEIYPHIWAFVLSDTPGSDGFLYTASVETVQDHSDDGAVLEVAFGQAAFTASPSWTDVSSYLKSLSTKRGRQHTLGRIEAGVATFVLDNADGDWWRGNTAGEFYPYVKPLCLVRLSRSYGVLIHRLWWGVVEGIRPGWVVPGEAGMNPETVLECVDMFKSFSRYKLEDANPLMTADANSGQKDVVVDSVYRLFAGQSIKIYDDGVSEVNYIASIDSDTLTVTMTTNLSNNYTVGNNGKLKKFPSVLSGTRINDVLYELQWPIAMSAVDAGQVIILEFTPPTGGTNCLEHMQKVTECEGGVIFMRAADGFFVSQDLIARAVQPLSVSQMTFKDDDTDSKYVHPELSDDDTFIYNEANVSGEGITAFDIKDTVAQAAQGPRALTMKDSLFTLDSDALNWAWIAAARFADSILRVKSLLCLPSASPADLWPKLLGNDISTRLTFQLDSTINPAEIAQGYHVEGIEHAWDALTDEWATKWQLWEVNQYRIAKAGSDGLVELTSATTYAALHDAALGDTVFNNIEDVEVGQVLVHAGGGAYVSGRIIRGYMEFDTSGLAADDVIDQAVLIFKLYAAYAESGDWDLTLVEPHPALIESPLVLADYGYIETLETSLGALTIDGTIGWVVLTLNAAGLAHIAKAGTTKFALRNADDISATDPGGTTTLRDRVVIYGKGSAYEPRLIVRIA